MKNDTLTRFAVIETQLLWGGGLTARELGEALGLARQNAQGVITAYQAQHPGNMVMDRKNKRQVAAENFTPCYISDDPGAFLDYERAAAMAGYFKQSQEGIDLAFYDVDRLLRPRLARGPIHEVLTALRLKQVVTIYYHAKTGARMRDISPNSLIFAGNRYHVRAYCHLMKQHLDFVVSRITHAEASETEWVSDHDDAAWQSWSTLAFEPEPQLPEETVNALRLDHNLGQKEHHKIRCRQALTYYVKRELLAVDDRLGFPRWRLVSDKTMTRPDKP